ncbi:MAG: hypothetical protein IK000_07695 [Bacteroidaceae bacterium]|nr:hypothetical protein [Bacteroidaceae bacterium]
MKTIRLAILFLFVAVFSLLEAVAGTPFEVTDGVTASGAYFPTGTTWTEAWFYPDAQQTETPSVTYEIGTDTVINEKTYKRVLVDGQEKGLWLREGKEKIWLLRDDFTQEIMLYDFNVNYSGEYNTTRQYIQNGELKNDTLPYSLDGVEFGWNNYCSIFVFSHPRLGETKMIQSIGMIAEDNRDCCILGSVAPESTPSSEGQCRLLTFSRNGKELFNFKGILAKHEFFTRDLPTEGLDLWLDANWDSWLIKADYLTLDGKEGKDIHVSAHYNKNTGKETLPLKLGSLEAGDYRILFSAVDDAGHMPPITHEFPLSVRENPVKVPCGIIRTSGENEQFVKTDIWIRNNPPGYTPDLKVTLEDDSLHITGWLNFNPVDHYCYYEIHTDSVYLETLERWESTMMTGLWGVYSVDFKIGPYRGDHLLKMEVAEDYTRGYRSDGFFNVMHSVNSTLYFDLTSVTMPEQKPTNNTPYYDLLGREIASPNKGIYIKDGKKVLIK